MTVHTTGTLRRDISYRFFSAVQSLLRVLLVQVIGQRIGIPLSLLPAAAFKIIGFASPVTDNFPEVLVKFNPGAHAYNNAVGIYGNLIMAISRAQLLKELLPGLNTLFE